MQSRSRRAVLVALVAVFLVSTATPLISGVAAADEPCRPVENVTNYSKAELNQRIQDCNKQYQKKRQQVSKLQSDLADAEDNADIWKRRYQQSTGTGEEAMRTLGAYNPNTNKTTGIYLMKSPDTDVAYAIVQYKGPGMGSRGPMNAFTVVGQFKLTEPNGTINLLYAPNGVKKTHHYSSLTEFNEKAEMLKGKMDSQGEFLDAYVPYVIDKWKVWKNVKLAFVGVGLLFLGFAYKGGRILESKNHSIQEEQRNKDVWDETRQHRDPSEEIRQPIMAWEEEPADDSLLDRIRDRFGRQ